MAEEKQNDMQLKYEDVIDVETELQRRKEFIEIALQSPDDTWTVYNTGDENVSVVYKQMPDSNVNTVRGKMSMKGDMDLYYKYSEAGYDDVYIEGVKESKNCTANYIVQLADNDHQVVYNSSNSGYMVVSARDFTYVRNRFMETDYTFNGVKYKKIIGCIGYSVDENHPFNVPTKKGHVRAHVTYSGNLISQREDAEDDEFEAFTILALDPCGMIPAWIKTKINAAKGLEVKEFVASWSKMEETVKTREQNNFQKQHKALF